MKFQVLFAIMLLAVATFNSVILIINREKRNAGYISLYTSLFFYNLCLLIYFVWFEAGFIKDIPQFLRTCSPLMYLCAPFFYFFIRNSIDGTTAFRKTDAIHFVPALIHFLDLIPFYFESYEVKSAFADAMVADHSTINMVASGLIPIQFHYLLRIFLQTGYFAYSIYLVYKFRNEIFTISNGKWPINNYTTVLFLMGWLVFFQLAYAVFEVFSQFGLTDLSSENYFLRRVSLLGLFGLNLFVNFKPEILNVKLSETEADAIHPEAFQSTISYSKKPDQTEKSTKCPLEQPEIISQKEIAQIKSDIISLLEEEQIFTEIGMTLNLFAGRVRISPKLVSMVINKEFGKGFNEFLNQYRIAFAITKIEDGYLDDYTLEALGEISGFNSRTTFFNAFKKEMGYSPSEYWRKFQQVPS
jgi:AraC-like DNA-binding protein